MIELKTQEVHKISRLRFP